jgi:hypothetical protein
MNQSGQIVFAGARISGGSFPLLGTFLWDGETRRAVPILLKDMPASGTFTFTGPGGFAPTLNNRGEIALVGTVRAPDGPTGTLRPFLGLYVRSEDGTLVPVLTPDHELPGGGRVRSNNYPAPTPSLNDAGQMAFLATRPGQRQSSAYLWDADTLGAVAEVGSEAPEGGRIASVSQIMLNNANRTAVVAMAVGDPARHGLYRYADRRLTPLVLPGREMPGGGRFRTLQGVDPSLGDDGQRTGAVSVATAAGEHAFLADLDDGSTAAYRLAADGTVSLVLKGGTTTDLGMVTRVGFYQPGLNKSGQAALVVRFDGGPDTVVLLSPTAP